MKRTLFLVTAAMLLFLGAGCSKTNDGQGRLTVNITDAPFPLSSIESASVTINKVELRKTGDGVSDGNPFYVIWEGSKVFNLIELRNGVVGKLAELEIPAGEYDLMRLYVEEASLKVKDGDEFSVKVPSGGQTGIKIFIEPVIHVEGGLTAELLLDFDLEGSFVLQGNMNSPAGIKGFHFKPVIRAVNNSKAGRIEGTVTEKDAGPLKDARVFLELEEDTLKAFTDESGHYAFIGIIPGMYPVSAVQTDYDSVIVEDVRVVAGNRTIQDFELIKK
ncbi:MAG: DUF4382 domain-containing protein [Bacteroidales bacterium]|jgi:hypothetical protein|nr:DUF4382 domain-containing protein [Bacteroidales bacterium]